MGKKIIRDSKQAHIIKFSKSPIIYRNQRQFSVKERKTDVDLPVSNILISTRGRTRRKGVLVMAVEISITDSHRHGFVHFR